MWKLAKKLLSTVIVLVIVALVLNLNFSGKPAREYAKQFWQNHTVQWVYQSVKGRVMAVINKDISVEEAFKPNVRLPSSSDPKQVVQEKPSLDHIRPEDKKELERIINKYSQQTDAKPKIEAKHDSTK
ncbi:MAG: hypothetical protein HYU97_10450 [Deltaproteobacteria bacterium]|nr:hypothetical protein [Deltaproteobacteria bacterium]